MSATGRSNVRELAPNDFYPTPAWCVRLILGELPAFGPVLDPCCGDGAILRVVRDAWGPGIPLVGVDVDPSRGWPGASVRDALLPAPWSEAPAALVLTNPPYRLARLFVERAIREQAPHRGTVAMLLRLAFLASKGRAALHQDHACDVYVLADRPSFTKDGKTDSSDYAWFVWGPDRGNRWAVLS